MFKSKKEGWGGRDLLENHASLDTEIDYKITITKTNWHENRQVDKWNRVRKSKEILVY